MERKMKTVYEEVSRYFIPSDVDGFIKFIEDKIEEIGVPRDSVSIEVGAREEYGDTCCYLDFMYTRPETDAEIKEREEVQERQKAREHEQYLRLKKKFDKNA